MRLYQESYGNVPKDIWALARQNFARELVALRSSFRNDDFAKVSEAAGDRSILLKVG